MHNQSLYLYFLFQFVPLVFIARVRKTHFQITLYFILVQNLVIVLASIFYIQGCNTKEAGKPLPSECNRCRVAKDINTKECVAECKEPNFLTAQKLCISKSGKLFEHHCNEICAHCTQQSVSFNSLFQYGLQVKSRMDSGFGREILNFLRICASWDPKSPESGLFWNIFYSLELFVGDLFFYFTLEKNSISICDSTEKKGPQLNKCKGLVSREPACYRLSVGKTGRRNTQG